MFTIELSDCIRPLYVTECGSPIHRNVYFPLELMLMFRLKSVF